MMLLSLGRAGIATENRLQIGPTADRARGAAVRRHRPLRRIYRQCRVLLSSGGRSGLEGRGGRLRPRGGARLRAKQSCLADPGARRQQLGDRGSGAAGARSKTFARSRISRASCGTAIAVKLAASAEFVESAAGLPAFEATYGFQLAPASSSFCRAAKPRRR